jgi:preprotein translocase subunit SecD
VTRERRQHPANDPVAPRLRPHLLPWLLAILVLASGCGRADETASSPSMSTGTMESSSASVAPSQQTDLQMRQVLEIVQRSSADWDETKLTCSAQGEALSECVASARDVGRIVLLRPEQGGQKYVLGSVIVDETDVAHATAQRERPYATQFLSYWSVYIDLTAEAAEAFQVATEAAVGSLDPQNQIAIIVEGRIVSSPTVAAPITSGNVVLTGSFTKTQARSLASNLSGSS